MILGIAVHLLAALVWVGGMFFAYVVLRPAAGPLDPPARLALWRRVFDRFFPIVWGAIAALLVSGYGMMFGILGGFGGAGLHIHLMQATGLIMVALFIALYVGPYAGLRWALDGRDPATAVRHLGRIRAIIATNLALGVATVLIGATGRYWG